MKTTLPFLRVFLLLSLFSTPLITFADQEGDYTYTVANNQATITDFNSAYAGPLSITNTLGGFPVTTIGDYAFWDCTSLTSVTIPDSVATVG